MSNFREKFLNARINYITKNIIIEEHRENLIEREETRDYERWCKKVKKRLPELAQRVFSLRSKHYEGCGLHYTMESTLGSVIHDLNSLSYYRIHNDLERIGYRCATKIMVESLFKDINEAEKSVKELRDRTS